VSVLDEKEISWILSAVWRCMYGNASSCAWVSMFVAMSSVHVSVCLLQYMNTGVSFVMTLVSSARLLRMFLPMPNMPR
jgi:hypothetical protein